MKISKEEAETQAKQDSTKVRKDIKLMKQKERDAKQKRLDEKCAGAVQHQKGCQERKRKAEILYTWVKVHKAPGVLHTAHGAHELP